MCKELGWNNIALEHSDMYLLSVLFSLFIEQCSLSKIHDVIWAEEQTGKELHIYHTMYELSASGEGNKKIDVLQSASVSKISILIKWKDMLVVSMVSNLNLQLSQHRKNYIGFELLVFPLLLDAQWHFVMKTNRFWGHWIKESIQQSQYSASTSERHNFFAEVRGKKKSS